jgi:hypothetical protein
MTTFFSGGPTSGLFLPSIKLFRSDNFPPSHFVNNTARLFLKSLCKFFCGANPLRHKPWADYVPILDFDGMATQRRSTIFPYLTNLLQQACHNGYIEGPEDHQPVIFKAFHIEVSKRHFVNQVHLI